MTAALASLPGFTESELSDDERLLLGALRKRMVDDEPKLRLCDDYYNGLQTMTTLGISLPRELEGVRTLLGWPKLAVDAIHERLDVEGFRYPDQIDADDKLWDLWQRSNLDAESPMAHLDALSMRRGFVVVGTDEDEAPLITVESPLHTTALWDKRLRHPRAVLQCWEDEDGTPMASLYLPDQTITLERSTRSGKSVKGWTIARERDRHGMGWVPVMMMANRGRTHDPYGQSEIGEEVQRLTDAGCRTLLDLEISREFYAAPQRFILGATQEAFQDPNGNPVDAWSTYRGRMLALERDEEGNLPTVGSFTALDPSAFTKVLDALAEQMASVLGLPPAYLGKSTDQPASADAIRMSTDRLVNKVRRKQRMFEQAWEGAMRMALAFQEGTIPDPARRIETIWRNPEIPTPAETTDAISKQVAAGCLPPESDVALERLGFSPNERARIKRDRGRTEQTDAISSILRRATSAPASSLTQAADAVAAVPGSPPAGTPAPQP